MLRFRPQKNLTILVSLLSLLLVSTPVLAEEWDDLMGSSSYQSQPDNKVNDTRPQIVKRLDQEILILRAEMSQRNGDVYQVKQYLEQLGKQQILPPFSARFERLKQYVANNDRFFSQSKQYVQKIDFPMNNANAVVAIVLPTSGDYEVAGSALQNALQEGLKQAGFRGKLVALDSNLYSSAFEMWELLKYYEPDFIFGPLQKERVLEWKKLRTKVPTLYFNEIGYLGVGEFSLSPSRLAGLEQVFQLLQQGHYQNVMVFSDDSQKSAELEAAFKQAWLSFNSQNAYQSKVIEGNVGQSINEVLGVEQSKQRHRWLEKVISHPLEFETRTRKDMEVVISFLPQHLAIQVSPYLDFLTSNKQITHIWYPSQTPDANFLAFNQSAWEQTFVILPQSILVHSNRKHSQIDTQSKNGLFHALGQVAVEIVKNSTLSDSVDTVELTQHGAYVRNASGQFHLLPVVYWADNGIFEKFYQLAE